MHSSQLCFALDNLLCLNMHNPSSLILCNFYLHTFASILLKVFFVYNNERRAAARQCVCAAARHAAAARAAIDTGRRRQAHRQWCASVSQPQTSAAADAPALCDAHLNMSDVFHGSMRAGCRVAPVRPAACGSGLARVLRGTISPLFAPSRPHLALLVRSLRTDHTTSSSIGNQLQTVASSVHFSLRRTRDITA